MAKKSDASAKKLITASVLAFERKLDPSDAVFHAGHWEKTAPTDSWTPIKLREKSVRGTISNRLKAADSSNAAKLDAKIEVPNLQTVDVAALPTDRDTLRVSFTLRVLSGAGVPNACNNLAYQSRLTAVVNQYAAEQQFSALAERYALNIANGRFLWRNRASAEAIKIVVHHIVAGSSASTWTFDASAFSLRSFEAPERAKSDVAALATVIKAALAGRQGGYALLEVVAYVRMGRGQEVFPSQELILDKGQSKKSKVLYDVDGVAGMHSQKIGNALRTIDTWYPDADAPDGIGPISVEPYGSVTSLGKAFRQPAAKLDFYSLLDAWVLHNEAPSTEQQHYVMANLIRGGVYGDSGK